MYLVHFIKDEQIAYVGKAKILKYHIHFVKKKTTGTKG